MFVTYEKIIKDVKMGVFRASIEKIGINLNYLQSYKHFSFFIRFFLSFSIDDSCQYWLKKMTLTSPYYPKYYLADGKGCQWIITAPVGHIVVLEFEEFNVSFKKVVYYYIYSYVFANKYNQMGFYPST